ncbi:MAG: NAD(P)H-hydrate dehydratase [Lachnospirales bacterium]
MLVNAQEMYKIENDYFNNFEVPSLIVMEQAGFKISQYMESSALVVCGMGNNGGDGFVVARHLFQRDIKVEIIFLNTNKENKVDAEKNRKIAQNLGIKINNILKIEDLKKLKNKFLEYDNIVDGIFGIGFHGEVSEFYREVFSYVNTGRNIISIDIPSGLNASTGKYNFSVKAHKTICLGLPKIGLYVYPGFTICGEIFVEELGFQVKDTNDHLISKKEMKLLPKRGVRSNKGSFGKCSIIAGSKSMTGAAILAGKSAYNVGCGYVKMYGDENFCNIIKNNIYEAVTIQKKYTDGLLDDEFILNKDIVVIGPGIGVGESTIKLVKNIILTENSMVIDGDALNILARDISLLNDVKGEKVLTPHPMEMSRLMGITANEVLDNYIDIAREFSKKYNVVLVLKTERTVVAKNGRIYLNTSGNSSLAKAGSGDVLAGIIGGLMSQGLDAVTSSKLGVYIHGRSGELVSEEKSLYSVSASDVCNNIGMVIKES